MSRAGDHQPDLPARLLHRRGGHQRLRPRRRHGRGAGPTSRRIGGTVDLEPARAQGTTLRIKIPLTLAIIPALIVELRRRPLRHPAGQPARAGPPRAARPAARGIETDRRRAGLPAARQLLPLVRPRPDALGLRASARATDERGRHRRRAGRRPAVRAGRGRGPRHRGDRGQAAGQQLKAMTVFAGATILGDGGRPHPRRARRWPTPAGSGTARRRWPRRRRRPRRPPGRARSSLRHCSGSARPPGGDPAGPGHPARGDPTGQHRARRLP